MPSATRNVLIAGATGSVGAPILTASLAEPTFKVTILSRGSSSAELPRNVPVIKVSDVYTLSELTAAFKDQYVVISALVTTPVTHDEGTSGLAYRLIDAALAAGAKRFIPSEFGANNLDPRPRALVPAYDRKGAMLEYLTGTCASPACTHGMTWTSISCGSWLNWALDPEASGNFLSMNVELLALSFSADVDIGYDFETVQELWSERLGLLKVRLEEVIADATKLAKNSP